jgi:hypothetical protein
MDESKRKHEIVIDITPEGKVVGEVKGVAGKSCQPLSKWLDELGEVKVDRHTPDVYKSDGQGVKVGH